MATVFLRFNVLFGAIRDREYSSNSTFFISNPPSKKLHIAPCFSGLQRHSIQHPNCRLLHTMMRRIPSTHYMARLEHKLEEILL